MFVPLHFQHVQPTASEASSAFGSAFAICLYAQPSWSASDFAHTETEQASLWAKWGSHIEHGAKSPFESYPHCLGLSGTVKAGKGDEKPTQKTSPKIEKKILKEDMMHPAPH